MIDEHGWLEWHGPPPPPSREEYQRQLEGVAVYRLYGADYYEDVYKLNLWVCALVVAQAKEEYLASIR